MRLATSLLLATLTLLVTCETTSAFVKGHVAARGAGSSASQSRTRPYMVGELNMAAAPKAKKAAKKAKGAPKAAAAKKAEKAPVDNFKKADFVASVAEKTGMTKAQSEEALNAVLDTITDNVAAGKRVSLQGFGTFQLRARAARKGRNPQTGEEIDIKASKSPGFTASKAFKEKSNM